MISPPLAPPQGGEVLSAGRARGQAAQGLPARALQRIGADMGIKGSRCRASAPLTRMPAPAKPVQVTHSIFNRGPKEKLWLFIMRRQVR